MTDVDTGAGRAAHKTPRLAVAVVSAGVWMASLDMFIVNLALPDMQRDFAGASLADLSWVLTAYATVFAALLVPAGRWADRVGRRRAYVVGLVVFTLASAVAAAADASELLVAARILQAAGAALIVPASLGLLLAVVEQERRTKAIASWAATGALAAAAGPVVGGLLVEASWRWVFLVNLPVGVATAVLALLVLTEADTAAAPRSSDLFGAAMLASAVGLLAFGLVRSEELGWRASQVVGALCFSLVLSVLVARRCLRHESPIVSPALLRVRSFRAANLASLLFYAAFAAMLLFAVLWLTTAWRYSPARAGLAIAVGPLAVPFVATRITPLLIARLGLGRTSAVGCLLFAVGLLMWTSLPVEGDYVGTMLPGLVLTGVGVGLTMPATVAAASAALPSAMFATGSAITTMSRQVGGVAGTAAFVALAGTTSDARALTSALWPFIVSAAAAGAVSLTISGPPVPPQGAVAAAAGAGSKSTKRGERAPAS